MRALRPCLIAFALGITLASVQAQQDTLPSARLVSAPRLIMPWAIDSNMPMTWDRSGGTARLFALTSWGGVPALLSGTGLDSMQRVGDVTFLPTHPGDGVWIESVIQDDAGAWYGYYHHEIPAHECGRPDRSTLRTGAARSVDRGVTWEDLGIVLDAPPGGYACSTTNRFVVGGVGDVSAMLDADRQHLFLFFSQYSREASAQGVALARLAWADRDTPVGKVTVWQESAWMPARHVPSADPDGAGTWEYPSGTPFESVTRPWHDGNAAADAFWGPSIHWNTYLERYVMLLNRAKDESFNNEGIYLSYARTLDDPRAWSTPRKLANGGGWYPQVAGLEDGSGTDKHAGQRARFFLTGRSENYIEFQR